MLRQVVGATQSSQRPSRRPDGVSKPCPYLLTVLGLPVRVVVELSGLVMKRKLRREEGRRVLWSTWRGREGLVQHFSRALGSSSVW